MPNTVKLDIGRRQDLSSALDREGLSSALDRDKLSSARTLYQAGRGSYTRGDVQSAKLFFGLAEKLFLRADDVCNAYIARAWYNILSKRGL